MSAESKTIREVHGFQCLFCGEIYESGEEAETCWTRHVQYVLEPIFLKEEYPVEVLVKKIEGNRYVEIATYTKNKVEKVDIPVSKEVLDVKSS